jgi:hypothetical protein
LLPSINPTSLEPTQTTALTQEVEIDYCQTGPIVTTVTAVAEPGCSATESFSFTPTRRRSLRDLVTSPAAKVLELFS